LPYSCLCVLFIRLCVFKQLPTLPRGCTLKDPPLVKTDHFLTKMPDLI
jgi:hypothetical protein